MDSVPGRAVRVCRPPGCPSASLDFEGLAVWLYGMSSYCQRQHKACKATQENAHAS